MNSQPGFGQLGISTGGAPGFKSELNLMFADSAGAHTRSRCVLDRVRPLRGDVEQQSRVRGIGDGDCLVPAPLTIA